VNYCCTTFSIRILKTAKQDLENLDIQVAKRIVKRIYGLAENLTSLRPTALKGELAGLFKLRKGDYLESFIRFYTQKECSLSTRSDTVKTFINEVFNLLKKKTHKNLIPFADHLDQQYGTRGTAEREEFEESFEAFKLDLMIQKSFGRSTAPQTISAISA
jgi:hypothetical protein